jgi:hypothetical protein
MILSKECKYDLYHHTSSSIQEVELVHGSFRAMHGVVIKVNGLGLPRRRSVWQP